MDYTEMLVSMMRFYELRAELVKTYAAFEDLCGAEDEINTLEAKRLLDNLDEIHKYITDLKKSNN